MFYENISKSGIEKEIESKGDFVQIDYLARLSKEKLPIDTKKFVYLKLAGIYERKFMFNDAAKMFDNIALISVAFSEKIKNYIKEAELHIRAGTFDRVDEAMKKAMNQANTIEKQDIYFTIKDFYKKQAEVYEKEMKRAHAVRIYEKLLEMKLNDSEREEIKEKLLYLYEKLGKFEEAKRLSRLW
jgi:tetratricopeptide (TPR) repeat protein